MAHIRIEDSGDKYRLSVSSDTWVCSEGPYERSHPYGLFRDYYEHLGRGVS
jgi:hypothetical protein